LAGSGGSIGVGDWKTRDESWEGSESYGEMLEVHVDVDVFEAGSSVERKDCSW